MMVFSCSCPKIIQCRILLLIVIIRDIKMTRRLSILLTFRHPFRFHTQHQLTFIITDSNVNTVSVVISNDISVISQTNLQKLNIIIISRRCFLLYKPVLFYTLSAAQSISYYSDSFHNHTLFFHTLHPISVYMFHVYLLFPSN